MDEKNTPRNDQKFLEIKKKKKTQRQHKRQQEKYNEKTYIIIKSKTHI